MKALSEFKIGESNRLKITASIDEQFYKSNNGNKISKGEEVTLINQKGQEIPFKVKRIMTGNYIILVDKNKKSQLSLIDLFKILYLGIQKQF